jgi:hypothetical protein
MEYAIIGAAAVFVSLLGGVILGAWLARRKFKLHYAGVCGEVDRLRSIAERKLTGDDPDLETLLRDLSDTVHKAVKAAEALENQGQVIRRKTEGGREIVASSRTVARMIEDYNGGFSEPMERALRPKETRANGPAKRSALGKKAAPQLG